MDFSPREGCLQIPILSRSQYPITILECKRGILLCWGFYWLDWLLASCWKPLFKSKSILPGSLKTPANPGSLIVPYSNSPFGVGSSSTDGQLSQCHPSHSKLQAGWQKENPTSFPSSSSVLTAGCISDFVFWHWK